MTHRWKGDDHPPGWRKVATIDVADPADGAYARDRDWRIGSVYDGGTRSVAEPCAADCYERVPGRHQVAPSPPLDRAWFCSGPSCGGCPILGAGGCIAVKDERKGERRGQDRGWVSRAGATAHEPEHHRTWPPRVDRRGDS